MELVVSSDRNPTSLLCNRSKPSCCISLKPRLSSTELDNDFPMTHMLITMTWYAGIVLGNIYLHDPLMIWSLSFVLLLSLLIPPTHAILLLFCAYSSIIAESFPVTITNHTSQPPVSVVSDWELPSFDILGFPLSLLPCRLRTSLENSRRTPSTTCSLPLSSSLTQPVPYPRLLLTLSRRNNWGSLDSPHVRSYSLCICRIFCSIGQPTRHW